MSTSNVKVLTETTEEPEASPMWKETAKDYAKVAAATVVMSVMTYFAAKKLTTWMVKSMKTTDEPESETTES